MNRIRRAKEFVNTTLAKEQGWGDNGKYADMSIFSFDNPARYYLVVEMDIDERYECKGQFATKKIIKKVIAKQLNVNAYWDVYERWDRIIIFDTKKNKVVRPKITLEKV